MQPTMKTNLIFLILLLFSWFLNKAQAQEIGIKAGISYADMSIESNEYFKDQYKRKTGFRIGGTFNAWLTDNWHVHSEILYSLDGAGVKDSDIKTHLHRLSFPVLAGYTFGDGKYHFRFGPEINVLLDASHTLVDNIDDVYKPLDFGLAAEFEVRLWEHFAISLKNYMGLIYQNEINFRPTETSPNQLIKSDKTHVLALHGIYYF